MISLIFCLTLQCKKTLIGMKCSVSQIAKVLSGEIFEFPEGRKSDCGFKSAEIVNDLDVSILLTDSRSLLYPSATIFFALLTKGNDGHRYIETLYRQGVRNFVVTAIPKEMTDIRDANFIIVSDTLTALQILGMYSRYNSPADVVAIAGSRGKTTIKEWGFQVLQGVINVERSPRSYNSQIGVPLSLWELSEKSQLALIETGISECGEMEKLHRMVSPRTVVLTGLSEERGDRFDSLMQKADEIALLTKGAQVVVYNADEEMIADALEKQDSQIQKIAWSQKKEDAPMFISSVKRDLKAGKTLIAYRMNGVENHIEIPFINDHDIENAITLLTFIKTLNIDDEILHKQMSNLVAVGTRLDVSDGVNNCTLIYDSYTSDLSSLWQALDFMGRRATNDRQKTLILSDLSYNNTRDGLMYEHIAELCKRAGIDRLIGIGKEMSDNAHLFSQNYRCFLTTEEFMQSMSTSDFSNELILIKGAPKYDFMRIRENLEARKHETVLEVNLDSVVKNFNYFRQHLPNGTGIVAMVKASGYGAGSYEIAKTLQAQGAAYLAVAVLDEGIDLRKAGITMPIMVMNPKVVNYKSMFAFHLEPEIYNIEMLKDVIREAEKYGVTEYPVHIKLDTGMHRMGFIENELPELMKTLNSQNFIVASSVFSHLATADCPDMDDYTLMQLKSFDRLTDYMQSLYPRKIKRHVLNSAGILRFSEYHYDMARLGIGLYGANTLPPTIERPLAVVSTLRTVIIAIREWEAGESVGYARRGIVSRKSRIATIPIGYADGMNRRFGNGRSRVFINGHYAPTIGNICMDACMIDVTDIPCKEGDIVEIFGENVAVQELADILDTIPYEVLTSVSPRVKRVYFRE